MPIGSAIRMPDQIGRADHGQGLGQAFADDVEHRAARLPADRCAARPRQGRCRTAVEQIQRARPRRTAAATGNSARAPARSAPSASSIFWRTSGGTVSGISDIGLPGARSTSRKITRLINSSVGMASSSRRSVKVSMGGRLGQQSGGRVDKGRAGRGRSGPRPRQVRSLHAEPVRDVPQFGVPGVDAPRRPACWNGPTDGRGPPAGPR